jgi:hypothetical protein
MAAPTGYGSRKPDKRAPDHATNSKIILPFQKFKGGAGVKREMVLLGRIELPTSSLPMTRSTTELQQPRKTSALEKTPYQ